MDSAPLLEITNLSIRFGDQVAVQDLSLDIAPGQTLGLVGESGSGKSVTSLVLLGLLPPTARVSGSIRFDGQELLALSTTQMRPYRGRHIAMIFQEPMTALNPVMRVGAQIGEALQAHQPSLGRVAIRDRVLDAMHEVALPEPELRLNDYPHQFSGGQRQRLLIAIALINRPRLLIADEPTTALDVTVQAQVLALLQQLRRTHNLAMLFISHDLAVVAEVCNQAIGPHPDRIAVMQHGRLVQVAPARELLRDPQHPYTRKLLASVPTMHTDRIRPLATLS